VNTRRILGYRLCSYTVIHDTGFAPNPFWGYCTLIACTPNHIGIRAQKGDWFIGHQTVERGSKLIYAMRVSKVSPFSDYFHDTRFQEKKPVYKGTWRQRCGDNIYFLDEDGRWQRHRHAYYHREPERVRQDLKHPSAFIAEHFYYFGSNAVEIPADYTTLIWKRQGAKCSHDPQIVKAFLDWLQFTFKPGIHGHPADNLDRGSC
jgi:hypothetical protein